MNKIPNGLEPDAQHLFVLINSENSAIAKVLVTTSQLESLLDTLIRNHLKECKETEELINDPFSGITTFAGKTKLAYCMSIIDDKMYKCLNQIRQIRNTFAHSKKNLSFGDNEISQKCEKLDYASFPQDELASKWSLEDKSKHRFLFSALALWGNLRILVYKTSHE